MKNSRKLAVAATIALGISIGAQNKSATDENPIVGNASYYSDKLHGRRMSNGDKYHRDSFTCAHLKFPLGTILKVRNPVNDKECIVKVTDRGPHTKKYIIDLSRAAAAHLGIISRGFAPVEITPYYSGTVPYKLPDIELPEIPELDLSYSPDTIFPYPTWIPEKIKINMKKFLTKDNEQPTKKKNAR